MPELPKFDAHDFKAGQPIDNPYFPLREGFTYHYAGKAQDDAGRLVPSPDNVRVQHVHKQVDGIDVLVVYDNVYLGGLKQEATRDYYAQDVHGNVWYMGEYETSYTRDKHGKIVKVSHESSWQAGVDGAKPGFIMPAQPKVGLDYYQEHLPGVALNSAKITAVDLTLNVQGKVYHHVVLTREFSQLEPTVSTTSGTPPGSAWCSSGSSTAAGWTRTAASSAITPNGGGAKVGALDQGAPGREGVRLAALAPWGPAGLAGRARRRGRRSRIPGCRPLSRSTATPRRWASPACSAGDRIGWRDGGMSAVRWSRPLYRLYRRHLLQQVRGRPLPGHVALILDGNRRDARRHGVTDPRAIYDRGAGKLDDVLAWCAELGIAAVTLWVCSTDNLARPADEVAGILGAFEAKIGALARDPRVSRHRIRVRAVGRLGLLPPSTVAAVREAEAATAGHERMTLTIAVAYGGREEVVDAVRALLREEARHGADLAGLAERLEPAMIDRHLYTAGLPEPDLIIRTSGEVRLSGFLLWQSTHSEFYFTDVNWPAFREIDFLRALRSFQQRARRFGR